MPDYCYKCGQLAVIRGRRGPACSTHGDARWYYNGPFAWLVPHWLKRRLTQRWMEKHVYAR